MGRGRGKGRFHSATMGIDDTTSAEKTAAAVGISFVGLSAGAVAGGSISASYGYGMLSGVGAMCGAPGVVEAAAGIVGGVGAGMAGACVGGGLTGMFGLRWAFQEFLRATDLELYLIYYIILI